MPYSCHQIPYPLIIAVDISPSSTTTLNPFSIIRSQSFSKYDYLISPISPSSQSTRRDYLTNPSSPIFLDDYYSLSGSVFKSQFVAHLHDIDFIDIKSNQDIITQDMDYCNHLSVAGINMALPSAMPSSSYFLLADLLMNFIKANPDRKINIEVPLNEQGYKMFTKLSAMTNNSENIRMSIVIQGDCDIDISSDIFHMITSHKLSTVILPLSLFITNKNGFPVLTKKHQELIKCLFKYKIELVLRDDIKVIDISNEQCTLDIIDDYYIYITHLFQEHASFKDNFECILNYYQDVLQTPLQPLKDNLQSQIYETFEEDKTKYIKYQKAISKAIDDLLKEKNKERINIGIFGGGRGPLVRATLSALEEKGIKDYEKENIVIFCVEKNINAFNTLLTLTQYEIEFQKVKMIYADMRTFDPKKYNINYISLCISELLGSFGDNELSPECLINIKQFMSKNGIMIPQEYSSYIEPVSCINTWTNIKTIKDSYESPYIIHFNRAFFPNRHNIQKCFTFTHYVNKEDCPLSQYQSITFKNETDTIITGFAGYFKAILYKDETLSICPGDDHTPNLVSWFPIYFPILRQIYVKKDDNLIVNIKRINNGRKVWYEWNVDSESEMIGYNSKVHNIDGEGYAILL